MTRRKEYLCWGLLAFAKHAGEEALRRHEEAKQHDEGSLDDDDIGHNAM